MNMRFCEKCPVANCPFKRGFWQECQIPMVKKGLQRFWNGV